MSLYGCNDGFWRIRLALDGCYFCSTQLTQFEHAGKLGFNEFVQLWRKLKSWCAVFQKQDRDGNNTISAGELKEAFREVGININRLILRMLVNRFGHHSKNTSTIEDQLYFDDFICCSLKMKRCIEVWNNKKNRQIGIPNAFSMFTRNILDQSSSPSESSFTLDEVRYFIKSGLFSIWTTWISLQFMRNVLYT